MLRGDLPGADIQVYITTDGSQPATKSARYTKPFDAALETTVQALVVLNGEVIYTMKERFSQKVGFAWEASANGAVAPGEQAESAKFEKAEVSADGKDFNGKGYLEFDKGSSGAGFVEWYFENDRSAGDFDLWVRYSASDEAGKKQRAILSVNGRDKTIELAAVPRYRRGWKVFKGLSVLDAGANYIRITPLDGGGLRVDELIVK